MSRPVHAPIAPPRPRPTGSFTEPRCGAHFGPAACELGGKSIARTASRRRGPRLLAGLLGIAVLAFFGYGRIRDAAVEDATREARMLIKQEIARMLGSGQKAEMHQASDLEEPEGDTDD